MDLASSQQAILQRLKLRGPQSVKILANQLGITTMGVRQHIAELESLELIDQTAETRQTRGRPVRLWKLTSLGHQQFRDSHGENSAHLLQTIRQQHGEAGLNQLIIAQHDPVEARYRAELAAAPQEAEEQLRRLAELRSEDGYMAEIRLLPDGWMLIEHHCPIVKAAMSCHQYCQSELLLFQNLLGSRLSVERVDHVPGGARRCAYKIRRQNQ